MGKVLRESASPPNDERKRPRSLTVEQVAEGLSAGRPTMLMLLISGVLRGTQTGERRLRRIAPVDLEHFICRRLPAYRGFEPHRPT